MLNVFVLIGGAFCGGALRYAMKKYAQHKHIRSLWATLLANAVSCFVLSLAVHAQTSDDHALFFQLFCVVGFCGALSTWSTLAQELGSLVKSHSYTLCAGYFSLTCICSVGAYVLGSPIAAAIFAT
ncbi:CrcB family protein [Corynebacterium sp. sy039]|uniref:FluC/FEX family fluoride channel n=1 Tax=Corynebacterium sp. sy039 TaxID=2599641 RepID=UPI0011B4109F|nr:CrcB family protein [Corynebacterium sp. sy039]QDZ43084.1 CrcB family protein [Corynebacterium sp. sy039]